jgi:hypothetical protein
MEANGGGKTSSEILKSLAIVLGIAAVISPLWSQVQGQSAQLLELRDLNQQLSDNVHNDAVTAAEHRGRLYERLDAMRDKQDDHTAHLAELDLRAQREIRDEIERSSRVDQQNQERFTELREEIARTDERVKPLEATSSIDTLTDGLQGLINDVQWMRKALERQQGVEP